MPNVSRSILVASRSRLFLAACAAMQQQKAQASRAADTGEFHNLQIFPQNITHDELIANMRGFAKALGTRCDHCHAANPPGSKEQFDFPSDAKPEKNVARAMMRMVHAANYRVPGQSEPARPDGHLQHLPSRTHRSGYGRVGGGAPPGAP